MAVRPRRRDLLAAALVAIGCYSPTLPLPPPSRPEVSALGDGRYQFVGTVEPRAEVIARNLETGFLFGQLTEASGDYDFVVEGDEGHPIQLWYVVGKDASQRTDFTLPAMQ